MAFATKDSYFVLHQQESLDSRWWFVQPGWSNDKIVPPVYQLIQQQVWPIALHG